MNEFFDMNGESGIMSDDPLIQSRYIDRFMLSGEMEAQKWAIENLKSKSE